MSVHLNQLLSFYNGGGGREGEGAAEGQLLYASLEQAVLERDYSKANSPRKTFFLL